MSDEVQRAAPARIGELRQLLKAMGDPWAAPDNLGDDDPLPDPPRGGELPDPDRSPQALVIESRDEFERRLLEELPTNPLVAHRWREIELESGSAEEATTGFAVEEVSEPEWGVG